MVASRRHILATAGAAVSAGVALAAMGPRGGVSARTGRRRNKAALWRDWSARFVSESGRVLDTGNRNISHSEGQGTALMASVWADDRAVFDRVLRWTDEVLFDAAHGLYHWRYDPASEPSIIDPNNATDGDLMIAWGLWQAGQQWDDEALMARAVVLATTIFDRLARPFGDGLVLLPGRLGFERADGLILNPSYGLFPAFDLFAQIATERDWAAVRRGYQQLLDIGRFGRFGLPSDWLLVADPANPGADGAVSLPSDWPPRFSFDAIRVPLYLVWGGAKADTLDPYIEYWKLFYGAAIMPAWFDLERETVTVDNALPGFYSVRHLTAEAHASGQPPGTVVTIPSDNSVASDPDYYSASLTLLSTMAADRWGAV